jgi:cell division protease FtsH
MSDNEKNSSNKNQKNKRPDDNFDWSKVIRMVFGWGAVIVAAVIVMQVFRTSSETFTEIPYGEYEILLETPENISSASIIKADLNDYTFKAELRSETDIKIKGKPVSVKAVSVYIPEPMIRDQEAVWKAKGIQYSCDNEKNAGTGRRIERHFFFWKK